MILVRCVCGVTSAVARSPRRRRPDPDAGHNPDRCDARAQRRRRGLLRSWRRRGRRQAYAQERSSMVRCRVRARCRGAKTAGMRCRGGSGNRRVCGRGGSRACRGRRRERAQGRRCRSRSRSAMRRRLRVRLPWPSGILPCGTCPGLLSSRVFASTDTMSIECAVWLPQVHDVKNGARIGHYRVRFPIAIEVRLSMHDIDRRAVLLPMLSAPCRHRSARCAGRRGRLRPVSNRTCPDRGRGRTGTASRS